MRVFVDTNIWVYRFDKRDSNKVLRTAAWLKEIANAHDIVISTQVLIELRSVLTKKFSPAVPHVEVRKILEILSAFEVVDADVSLILDAHELSVAHQISWFDALIVEAASRSQCDVLYSEDMQSMGQIGKLKIINPYAEIGR
jgi:predicted nucleic acid-binding protein